MLRAQNKTAVGWNEVITRTCTTLGLTCLFYIDSELIDHESGS